MSVTRSDSRSQGGGRAALLARGILLEYLTIGYNIVEAVVAIGAGIHAGSIALVGFGLDSVIEIVAGAALLWRLRLEKGASSSLSPESHSSIERKALYIVGITFFALAAYIAIEAVYKLAAGSEASESFAGIVLAAASLVIMPVLAWLKHRTARALGSAALAADATETWICSYLSLVLLLGLLLNALMGWGWADSIAALAMLPLIVKEGFEALEESREA